MKCLKTGKIRHTKTHFAELHAKSLLLTLGIQARAYRCPWCHGFHVTTKPNETDK